jgi:chemotaxis methyl-accepting protein methylase/signal transduction histidine kinase/chemotaxis response regulator CheB
MDAPDVTSPKPIAYFEAATRRVSEPSESLPKAGKEMKHKVGIRLKRVRSTIASSHKLLSARSLTRTKSKELVGLNSVEKEGMLFPIVGIGASAGGLEAFTQLLKHLPVNTGMGFVLVQHLDPLHESALAQLLGRATTMRVQEVTNNLRVEPNRVYVIPPNTSMEISKGGLKLRPRSEQKRGAQHSIDSFFESLAHERCERAIGVVLSGTASDGTLGLEAIKAEGGITFAQDESAKFDSMPRNAIAAGCVDFVLSPEAIAKELARIAQHPMVASASGDSLISPPEAGRGTDQSEGPEARLASGGHGSPHAGADQVLLEAKAAQDNPLSAKQNGFKKILLLLRNHCGVDFSLYKSSTIQRRVTRRMILNRQNALGDYATFLKGNSKELDALYSDVLISVTSFFRNPEAFETLKRKVFPALLAQNRRDGPVRVWTLGCSTGQEAYSIAMSFAEFSEKTSRAPKLQIFATDLNEALLEKARHGLYAKTLAQDVSPERLRRFFVEEEGGYRVSKALREQVVFARQNVMSDPPFSRMDLISCRNLLIYLEAGLQRKIMPAFHYALNPGGFLFLGTSETVGQYTELFEPADKKQRIFSRKAAQTPLFRLPLPHERSTHPSPGQRPLSTMERAQSFPEGLRGEFDAQREADRLSVSQFVPPGVLINAEQQVLQFRGATSAYLEPPIGKASFDVLKMAREGLLLPLRAAINKAKRDQKAVRRENVRVRQNGGTRGVHLQVIPLKNLKERCYLILFEDAKADRAGGDPPSHRPPTGAVTKQRPAATGATSRRVAELEAELSETRDYLQSIQEQYEASTEELQASGEEVQSANEELQSINEELETSKEELESTNEELITVNEEMLHRNVELKGLNNDLNNLTISINTAILVLGRDLTIRRFTVQAEKIFNLSTADVGRPMSGIRHNLDCRDLEEFVREVIDTVSVRQREVRDREGHWYSLRARPYLTNDNKIDGAVLVVVDIEALKGTERALRKSESHYRALFNLGPVAIYSCDATGLIQEYNMRAEELWGRKPKPGDTDERFCGSFKLFGPDGSFIPHAESPMAKVLNGKLPGKFEGEVLIERPDGSRFLVFFNIVPLMDERGAFAGAINCFMDISALKQAMELKNRLDTIAVTNREMEREIARRGVVEQSLKSSELHLRQSLDQTRQLAHRILSAHEQERKQISHELHDEVAQSLTGIGVHLSALEVQAVRNPKGLAKSFARTQKIIRKSMEIVHRFARELRPAMLDDLGLVATLHSFLKEFKQRTGLHVRFTASASLNTNRLDSERNAVLFRVAQSALNNIAQHAQASIVNVSLLQLPSAICMEIKDNGKGFQVQRVLRAKRYKRLGLPIMKERVEMAGGGIAIESAPGSGTTIRVQIPFDTAP